MMTTTSSIRVTPRCLAIRTHVAAPWDARPPGAAGHQLQFTPVWRQKVRTGFEIDAHAAVLEADEADRVRAALRADAGLGSSGLGKSQTTSGAMPPWASSVSRSSTESGSWRPGCRRHRRQYPSCSGCRRRRCLPRRSRAVTVIVGIRVDGALRSNTGAPVNALIVYRRFVPVRRAGALAGRRVEVRLVGRELDHALDRARLGQRLLAGPASVGAGPGASRSRRGRDRRRRCRS